MTFITILLSTIVAVFWFYIVLLIAKYTVGKDAATWCIFTILFISGPLGWAVVLIIWATDITDKFTKRRLFKRK
jgi:hypothetical protein